MTTQSKPLEVKVEKLIAKTPAEVFQAIGKGRLFMTCGADQESMKIDFKTGGKYSMNFLNYKIKNHGTFLEVDPYKKIVFTWCQDYDSNPEPDTTVDIELKDLGGKTALTLTHTGFSDEETRANHEGGWNAGLEDLSQEVVGGKLRLIRKVPMSIDKLFENCKNLKAPIGTMGETLEVVPNKKVIFNLKSPESRVSLLLDTDDDDKNISWLELIHEGLGSESLQVSHRGAWDSLLKNLK